MGPQIQTVLYLTVGALAFLPISSVRASCNNEFDNNCGFELSRGAAFGIALGILVIILAGLMMMRIRRQRQAQQANLALIRVAQGQQGNHYQGPTRNYQPNYAGNSNPNYTPNQSYPATPEAYYSPPPGPPPPRDSKGHESPAYDPTNAPQYPPPTYNV